MSNSTIRTHPLKAEVTETLQPAFLGVGRAFKIASGLLIIALVARFGLQLLNVKSGPIFNYVGYALFWLGFGWLAAIVAFVGLIVLGARLSFSLFYRDIREGLQQEWQLEASPEQIKELYRKGQTAAKEKNEPSFTKIGTAGVAARYVIVDTPKGENPRYRLEVDENAPLEASQEAKGQNSFSKMNFDLAEAAEPARPQPAAQVPKRPTSQAVPDSGRFRKEAVNREAAQYLIDGARAREVARGDTPEQLDWSANLTRYSLRLDPDEQGVYRKTVQGKTLDRLLREEAEAMRADDIPETEIKAWEAQMVTALNNV